MLKKELTLSENSFLSFCLTRNTERDQLMTLQAVLDEEELSSREDSTRQQMWS